MITHGRQLPGKENGDAAGPQSQGTTRQADSMEEEDGCL
jgi:hypothetical protein